MVSSNSKIKQDLINSEMKYIAFIQAFLHFLSLYFKENSSFTLAYQQRFQLERNIVSSLMMIEMLHFHLIVRNTLCKQALDVSDLSLQSNKFENRETIRKLLIDVKNYINNHEFLDESDKQCSKKIVKHLLNYYEKGTVVFDPPVTTPWLANLENLYPYPYMWGKQHGE